MMLIIACSETSFDSVHTQFHPELQPEKYAGPETGYKIVIVSQNPGADGAGSAGASVVDNLADALDRVASGGTIKVFPGTYPTPPLGIDKPLTLEGEGAETTVIELTDDPSGTAFQFIVNAANLGTVSIRGVTFRTGSGSGVLVAGMTENVLLERNKFVLESGSGVFVAQDGSVPEQKTRIRDNVFEGGFRGVDAAPETPFVEVTGNTFRNQQPASNGDFGISVGGFSDETRGVIRENSFFACDGGCISVGGRGINEVDILNNEFAVDLTAGRVDLVIGAGGRGTVVTIRGNTITGEVTNPTDPSTYSIGGGIEIYDGARGTVSENTIGTVMNAIAAGRATTVSGLDNVIHGVYNGINENGVARLSIRSSDFTRYQNAMNVVNPRTFVDLTCNWWGSADGPTNAHAPEPLVYTPWATEPVAGSSISSCNGGI